MVAESFAEIPILELIDFWIPRQIKGSSLDLNTPIAGLAGPVRERIDNQVKIFPSSYSFVKGYQHAGKINLLAFS
jgi:hypothetical protein